MRNLLECGLIVTVIAMGWTLVACMVKEAFFNKKK